MPKAAKIGIWVVHSVDDLQDEPVDTCVAGAYLSQKTAVKECAKYILQRAANRLDLADALDADENHPDFPGLSDRRAVRKYLENELLLEGGYYVFQEGVGEFRFEVSSADVEDPLWILVTRGDSDGEDPQFQNPWPAVFASEDKAVEYALAYLRDLAEYAGWEPTREAEDEIRLELREDGVSGCDLRDGAAVQFTLTRVGALDTAPEKAKAKKTKRAKRAKAGATA